MKKSTKQKITLAVLGAIWLLILFFFIDLKMKAAAFILPIFTVGIVCYLAYLSFVVAKDVNSSSDDDKENNS